MSPTRARRWPVLAVAVLLGLVGSVLRLAVLRHTDGLLGASAYDDGVYFAAGTAFAHGRWPYADFVFLQPPGVVLATAPFGALGAVLGDPTAVKLARLAWIGVGGLNCALAVLVAARRSWAAGLVAGAFAACFFPLVYGERSTLLEPLGTALLLLAVLVGERGGPRAAIVAGALAGAAVDVKIWYVLPVLVLVGFARHRVRFLLAAVGGGLVVVAPFLLRDPGALIRQVVLDQLGRPRLATDTFVDRFVVLTGAQYTRGATDPEAHDVLAVAVGIAVLVLAAAVVAWRSRLGRTAVVQLATTTTVLLASPSFFTHYVTYAAPWAAVVLGIGGAAVVDRVGRRPLRAVVAVALAGLVAAPTLARDLLPPRTTASIGAVSAAAARVDGCVRSDDPGLLAAMDVLTRSLDRGCALWPDVTGVTYDRPDFPTVSTERPSSAAWQRYVLGYLLGGDAVVVNRTGTGLSEASKRRIADLPLLARSGGLGLHAVPR